MIGLSYMATERSVVVSDTHGDWVNVRSLVGWWFGRSLASTIFACIFRCLLYLCTVCVCVHLWWYLFSICVPFGIFKCSHLYSMPEYNMQSNKTKQKHRMIQSKRFFKHFLRATCLWQILFSLILLFQRAVAAAVYLSMSVWIHSTCIQMEPLVQVESRVLLSFFRAFNAIQFDRINAKFSIHRFQFSQHRNIFYLLLFPILLWWTVMLLHAYCVYH